MVAVTYPNLTRAAYVPRVLVARRDRRGLYRKCEPAKAGEQGEVVFVKWQTRPWRPLWRVYEGSFSALRLLSIGVRQGRLSF